MKYFKFRFFFFLFWVMMGLHFSCFSQESNFKSANHLDNYHSVFNEDKIYISPEQVIISQEGLFLVIDSTVYAIEQLNADASGIYVDVSFTYVANYVVNKGRSCKNGHMAICKTCKGCSSETCRYGCKCKKK